MVPAAGKTIELRKGMLSFFWNLLWKTFLAEASENYNNKTTKIEIQC